MSVAAFVKYVIDIDIAVLEVEYANNSDFFEIAVIYFCYTGWTQQAIRAVLLIYDQTQMHDGAC